MGLKNNPVSLYNVSLQTLSKSLLNQWKNTYYTSYSVYVEELKSSIGNIPYTIYDQIFDTVVELHARDVQDRKNITNLSISSLVGSIINPNQRRLCLSCLRHIGIVLDVEIIYLENTLINELRTLTNLEEICLQTSGKDSTLPTCNDEILDEIGKSCPKLKTLDISYNHTVTDMGLEYLLPSESRKGCASLVKLNLFECSVTTEGVAHLLKGLSRLKFLGYRETGQSLLNLTKHNTSSVVNNLQLAHVNNLGVISRTCKDVGKLRCTENLVNALSLLCPKLNGLKVRIADSDISLLKNLNSISILELVYNLGTPASPSNGTVQYLNFCGARFVSLSFICNTFTTKYLKVVCEQCNNLKRLWIRCNNFHCDQDVTNSDKKKCSLYSLEVFFFRVGWPGFDESRIPQSVINYILHKSSLLREVVFAMNNSLFCDTFIQTLFSSIQTTKLREIMILVPHKNIAASSINLTMSSVEALICICPKLEKLGNLLVWDVSLEEIQELRRQLKLTNSALVLVYKLMTI